MAVSGGKARAAFGATTLQDFTPAPATHAVAKSMATGTLKLARLVSAFHEISSESSSKSGACYGATDKFAIDTSRSLRYRFNLWITAVGGVYYSAPRIRK
jgi:hypothetical protein